MIGDQGRQDPPDRKGSMGHMVGRASELGVAMGLLSAAMLLGSLTLGRWLDRVVNASPIFTIALLVVGALAGQAMLYRMAVNAVAQLEGGARRPLNGQMLRRSIVLGMQVLALAALPTVAGAGLGVWLDRRIHSVALFTVLLALLGFGLGMVLMARAVRRHRDKFENA